MFIIATKDTCNGAKFHGPFNTWEAAEEYADLWFRKVVWEIELLMPPQAE